MICCIHWKMVFFSYLYNNPLVSLHLSKTPFTSIDHTPDPSLQPASLPKFATASCGWWKVENSTFFDWSLSDKSCGHSLWKRIFSFTNNEYQNNLRKCKSWQWTQNAGRQFTNCQISYILVGTCTCTLLCSVPNYHFFSSSAFVYNLLLGHNHFVLTRKHASKPSWF